MILLLIFAILVAIVAAMFALENTTAVTVTFLSFRFEGSLAVVLMVVFGMGILTASAVLLPGFLRTKWQELGLRKKLHRAGILPDKDPDEPSPEPSSGEEEGKN